MGDFKSLDPTFNRAVRVSGLILSQRFAFYTAAAIDLFDKFKPEVYRAK